MGWLIMGTKILLRSNGNVFVSQLFIFLLIFSKLYMVKGYICLNEIVKLSTASTQIIPVST